MLIYWFAQKGQKGKLALCSPFPPIVLPFVLPILFVLLAPYLLWQSRKLEAFFNGKIDGKLKIARKKIFKTIFLEFTWNFLRVFSILREKGVSGQPFLISGTFLGVIEVFWGNVLENFLDIYKKIVLDFFLGSLITFLSFDGNLK